ncbi:MAG TPA: citramalate synthase [Solirubrobacteraceae bacterium]|nr:citramalate synthase [Solirubrobacteraceae bacterium]
MSVLELYDATLRDGMGGGGMSLTAQEKVRVAHALDELGIDLVEAGFPASNPKELELFQLLSRERFAHARIVAFGMTRRRDTRADRDEGLLTLADCFAEICTLVGKASMLHVERVLKVSPAENLAMISESIAFLVEQGKRVLFDAEHFFDGAKLDLEYSLECVRTASEAGAERVVLCDTNGGSLPDDIRAGVSTARATDFLGKYGIHTHDDSGCAVANTLVAVQSGATQVQGTINGVGERTGNANLLTLIADLQLKMGFELMPPERMAKLTSTGHFLDELLNRTPNPAQPYVGRHAFAHKAGMHAAGARETAEAFEHIDPALVGNHGEVLISELSGRAAIAEKAAAAGIPTDEEFLARVLARVKELEHRGFQFEAADGSFELLMRREAGGDYEPLFKLDSWRVIVERDEAGRVRTEATIRIEIAGERHVRTAEGNGPVHALDRALREAIVAIHPHLREIQLVNFKVRILDESKGTGAVTRVLIDASDGHREWGSIGVSENLIAASWDALVDSLEYGMLGGRVAQGAGRRDA